LHEPVQRYLLWFRVADPDASTRITLRHLLHHTGGLPERAHYAAFVHPDLSDGALEDGVRDLRSVELSQPVGAGHQYSNSGYAILGLIVASVTCPPCEDAVRWRLRLRVADQRRRRPGWGVILRPTLTAIALHPRPRTAAKTQPLDPSAETVDAVWEHR
jgi:Beta-lactamase